MSREENVLGLPAHVHANRVSVAGVVAQMVVTRCADIPSYLIPEPFRSRNRIVGCDECREMCWYDPVHAIPGLRIVCSRCAPEDLEIHTTDEQVAEIRRAAGAA